MTRAAAAFALLTAGLGALSAADSLFVALRPGVVPFILLLLTILLATGSGRALAGRLGLSDMSESQKTLVGATLGIPLALVASTIAATLGFTIARLTVGDTLDPATLAAGVKARIARLGGYPDFPHLDAELRRRRLAVRKIFDSLLGAGETAPA